MSTSYDGVVCSSGVAVGPAWLPRAVTPAPATVRATPERVVAAFETAALRLLELAASCRRDGATTSAEILETEAFIARDPTFAGEVVERLESADGVDALAVLRQVTERHAGVMESLPAGTLRERAADIREVGRRVADELSGRVRLVPPSGPFVLVDEEVCAPDLLEWGDRIAGAVSVRGGASSHASIVARSLGVPLVSQVDPHLLDGCAGHQILVDGDAGRVSVNPERTLFPAAAAQSTAAARAVARSLPATTLDGIAVTLLANVASSLEARRALDAGAAGVGLLRTELPFLDARAWPSAAEHEAQLRPVLEVLTGHPVTVRILDFSNDKIPPFLVDAHHVAAPEDAPVVLGAPEALDAQLQAILRVGRGSDVRVLVPMVTRPEELSLVRARLTALSDGGVVPLVGAMIESPAAVDNLPALLAVADFLSVGTNDLTATTLGLARSDPRLEPAMAAHPQVLAMVEQVVLQAAAAATPVSVCGDGAAHPVVLPRLLSLGVTTISVAPSRLDDVRALVRDQSVRSATASGRHA